MHSATNPKRIRRSLAARFWEKVRKTPGCWLWTGAIFKAGGYGKIALGAANDGTDRAHRVSYRLHFGEIPSGSLVCHTCDIPSCVRPDHLFLGTSLENSRDMVRKGRQRSGNTKLTIHEVREIRRLSDPKRFTQTALASIFGVDRRTISDIVIKRRRRNVI